MTYAFSCMSHNNVVIASTHKLRSTDTTQKRYGGLLTLPDFRGVCVCVLKDDSSLDWF